jgi:thiamine-monophosphate kinase
MQLAISTDMLVAGTHFFADTDPEDLGWKTLAVNVSDLAAMGAQPRWVVLAASLPAADEAWIAAFAGASSPAAKPSASTPSAATPPAALNLCPTIFGEVPSARPSPAAAPGPATTCGCPAPRPRRPRPGPSARRTGSPAPPRRLPGRPAAAAAAGRPRPGPARPRQRMLDVSDGLLGDLGHILEQSAVGAVISEEALPLAPLQAACGDAARAFQACTAGGDDYELLFAAPAERRADLAALSARLKLPLHRIGAHPPHRAGCSCAAPTASSPPGRPRLRPLRALTHEPNLRFLLSDPAHFVALGFGSGLWPKGPGTAGTLAGWLLFPFVKAPLSDPCSAGCWWPASCSASSPASAPGAASASPTTAASCGTRSSPSGWSCGSPPTLAWQATALRCSASSTSSSRPHPLGG